ncbi:MAG: flagellar hook-associated protein FlgK, partial [Candidatus Dadabacteria bacterium]
MATFGTKIFNTAISSLNAQQAVLAGISNNIANANTPGYARRTVQLTNQTLGEPSLGLNIGSGVKVSDVERRVDEYINSALRGTISEKEAASTENDFISRIENLFDLTGTYQTVGTSLTDFFSALNDLSADPSSLELRANLYERANDLVNSINLAYNTISDLQNEADNRLATEISTINTLTAQIADLNQKVVKRENSGAVAADERDMRDHLLEQLAEKISFSVTELSDGSINVSLDGGIDLVHGSISRDLEVTRSPSFAGSTSPVSLSGSVPYYVVINYGTESSPAHVNLTSTLSSGEGTLAGLLRIRGVYDSSDTSPFEGNGVLPAAASRIEAITRYLLTTFNNTYLGGGNAVDLDGNNPSVYGFFDFDFSGTKDADGNGVPDDLGNHSGVTNYSSILKLGISDARNIAAGTTSGAPGDGSNLSSLIALQTTSASFSSDSAGSYTYTGTIEEVYRDGVTYVGNKKANSDTQLALAESNYEAAANNRDEVSAVSIDEEFASLVKYQKAYEASARLINVANDLLDQIML